MIDYDGSREPLSVATEGYVPAAEKWSAKEAGLGQPSEAQEVVSTHEDGTQVISIGLVPDEPVDDAGASEWDEPVADNSDPEEKIAVLEASLRRAKYDRIRYEGNLKRLRVSRKTLRYWILEVERLNMELIDAKQKLEEARESHLALEERLDSDYVIAEESIAKEDPEHDSRPEYKEPTIMDHWPTDGDMGWKSYSISNLDLTKGIDKALRVEGLDTIGLVADFVASGKDLTNVPEIGRVKSDRIIASLIEFWEERKARIQEVSDFKQNSKILNLLEVTDQDRAEYAEDVDFVESANPEDPFEEQADLSHGNEIDFYGEGSLAIKPKDEGVF